VKRVFVCSPYRGDVKRNVAIARAACHDVLRAGDAPFAPHVLYPGLLDDDVPEQRAFGIGAGLAWLAVADEILVVGEPTEGMRAEIAAAETLGIPIRRRAAPDVVRAARHVRVAHALRCRLVAVWADWGALVAIALTVLAFLLCPGCVGGGRASAVPEGVVEKAPT
jgi:hypothetical protein